MGEGVTKIMPLEPKHIDALDRAERLTFPSDFNPYLELKALLPDATPDARKRFCSLFTSYYGLNSGGITDEFKAKYFEVLFGGNVILNGQPDYAGILNLLYGIKRRKGDYALQFSFVSKLVGIHLESRPIYDRHVLAYFGEKAPAASVENYKRIEWYEGFLSDVGHSYETWAKGLRVRQILERLKARDSRLKTCHEVRLLDFLVWKVGNKKLLCDD